MVILQPYTPVFEWPSLVEACGGSDGFAVICAMLFTVSCLRLAAERNRSSWLLVQASFILLGAHAYVTGSPWLLVSVVVFAGVGAYGLLRIGGELTETVPSVETVATRMHAPEGLAAVLSWLSTAVASFAMPEHAVALVRKIREHVDALAALELPHDHSVVTDVAKMIGTDVRDLLIRYRKVTAARRLLPGNSEMGDAELVNGLVKIEQALVEKRKTLATAALNDLKVQAGYIDAKHGDVN